LKGRIEPPLESQRGAGIAAHRATAGRAGEVGRIERQRVIERSKLDEEAVVELFGESFGLLGTVQVWAAGVPDEEGVSGQEEPRFGTSGLVGHEQADAVGGMTRRVEDPHLDVAQLELVPIFQRVEGKMRLRSLVEIDRRARLRRQPATAGEVVRLNVGLDDMRDPHSAFLAGLEILIDLLLWIHHSRRALSRSPEEI